jgi:DNA-binding SARP family transcriptional activator
LAAVIQLIGRPAIHRGDGRDVGLRGKKTWALLAFVALSDRPVARQQLVRMLFPEADDPLGALRWALSEVRRGVGCDANVGGDPVTFRLMADTVVDAQQVLTGGTREAVNDAENGELLDGMCLADCPDFELWLSAQRDLVASAIQAALRAQIAARLDERKPAEAVRLARRLVRLAPLDEGTHALLVRSLASTGDQAGAQMAAGACATLFLRELGTRPSPRVALAALAPVAGVTLLPDGRRLRARLEIEAGKAALAAGAVGTGLDRLHEAVAIATDLGDPGIRAEACTALGAAMVHTVALTDAIAVSSLREATELARIAGTRATAATAFRELSFVAVGARRDSTALIRQAHDLAAGDDGQVAAVLGLEAVSLTDSGRYHDAIDTYSRSITLAEHADSPRQAAWSLTLLARARLQQGDFAAGRVDIDRAMALVRAERWTAFLPLVLALSAELDLHEGRLDQAGEQLACAWAMATDLHDQCWLSVTGRALGLLAERRGNLKEALRWLDGARTEPSDNPKICRWIDVSTLDSICDISATHRLPRAQAMISQLADLSTTAGMPDYLARSRAYAAKLDVRTHG